MPSRVTQQLPHTPATFSRRLQLLLLLALWAVIYLAAAGTPPVLDDADATHAQAAEAMLRTGDWVTLHVDGIRYLEKPPLPYWITALSLRTFGVNSFAVHLPLALTVLGLALLAWCWGRALDDEGDLAGFYAALFILTATGVFLFTRIFIPDALLSLLLAFTLFAGLRALEQVPNGSRAWACAAWAALAGAVLTKGLVALVFVFGAFALYLPLSGEARLWRRLHPLPGTGLFLAIAAPWHILAGMRNRGGADGHGFFWFYFINEHVLRFLGRRIPADYNKLPASLYWLLHLVWLFPWSFFLPLTALHLWRSRSDWLPTRASGSMGPQRTFTQRSALLLLLFSTLVLVFFSLSTNQEYYTFPVYLPLLLLTAAALTRLETAHGDRTHSQPAQRLVLLCHAALCVVGMLAAVALGCALWSSRHLPSAKNVGDLLAHRGVGDYTLSMSHLFDLTGPAFSALRLPAALAGLALAAAPLMGLQLRRRKQHRAAILTLAAGSLAFLLSAHIALGRFAPILSSQRFAADIQHLRGSGAVAPGTEVLLYGDQALGSSIPFYLGQQVELVDGRSTSMLFGSTFLDAPRIFLTPRQLKSAWGRGPRKLLFVPLEHRQEVDTLLGADALLLDEAAGKALYTDRPVQLAPHP